MCAEKHPETQTIPTRCIPSYIYMGHHMQECTYTYIYILNSMHLSFQVGSLSTTEFGTWQKVSQVSLL